MISSLFNSILPVLLKHHRLVPYRHQTSITRCLEAENTRSRDWPVFALLNCCGIHSANSLWGTSLREWLLVCGCELRRPRSRGWPGFFVVVVVEVCFLTHEQLFSLCILPCGRVGGALENFLVINTVFILKQSSVILLPPSSPEYDLSGDASTSPDPLWCSSCLQKNII